MTPALVLAVLFDVFALCALLYVILGKNVLKHMEFRKYLVGVAGVYLSGTVFITIIVAIAKDLPFVFAIIAEIAVAFMFIMSYITVVRLTNNLEAIRAQMKEKASAPEDN